MDAHITSYWAAAGQEAHRGSCFRSSSNTEKSAIFTTIWGFLRKEISNSGAELGAVSRTEEGMTYEIRKNDLRIQMEKASDVDSSAAFALPRFPRGSDTGGNLCRGTVGAGCIRRSGISHSSSAEGKRLSGFRPVCCRRRLCICAEPVPDGDWQRRRSGQRQGFFAEPEDAHSPLSGVCAGFDVEGSLPSLFLL